MLSDSLFDEIHIIRMPVVHWVYELRCKHESPFDLIIISDLLSISSAMRASFVKRCVDQLLAPDGIGLLLVGIDCPVHAQFRYDVVSRVWPTVVRPLIARPPTADTLDDILEQQLGFSIARRYEFDSDLFKIPEPLDDDFIKTFVYDGSLDDEVNNKSDDVTWQAAVAEASDLELIRKVNASNAKLST